MARRILIPTMVAGVALLVWVTFIRVGDSAEESLRGSTADRASSTGDSSEELIGEVLEIPARSSDSMPPEEEPTPENADEDWWRHLTPERLAHLTYEGKRSAMLHTIRENLSRAVEEGDADALVRESWTSTNFSVATILDQVGLWEELTPNATVEGSSTRIGSPRAGERWTRLSLDNRAYRVDHDAFPEYQDLQTLLDSLSSPGANVQMDPELLSRVLARNDEALDAIEHHPKFTD